MKIHIYTTRLACAVAASWFATLGLTAAANETHLAARPQAQYVIIISVDGMGSAYIKPLLVSGIPNELSAFKRLQTEGVGTLNARDDADFAITLPNHITMITSRGVKGEAGHGWWLNRDSTETLASHKGSYVTSGFDVAHDHGLRTGIWSGKSKFRLFQQSYSDTTGAPDIIGDDQGRDKIDCNQILPRITAENLTADFTQQMLAKPIHFVFLHYQDPDVTGHHLGWSTNPASAFATTLKAVDSQIGQLLVMVQHDPMLMDKTAIILTADHGGHNKGHGDVKNPLDFTIPFYVWGPGVPAGRDLYAMNLTSRMAPGAHDNPPYTGRQPIRNGEAANLALGMLGLEPVPGSTINSNQDLTVIEENLAPSH